ncbi:hypothetical protein AMTR_s00059p00130830 [Amborella trichopoda]|uniref:Uncharacterized protein n=1 Tax=Amborella trichopoda TaxID=13333 RepID=U5CW84_AMBTC|nr:hypothetical protein AMTR_s00059p00130830 [Amborella trichopoda]
MALLDPVSEGQLNERLKNSILESLVQLSLRDSVGLANNLNAFGQFLEQEPQHYLTITWQNTKHCYNITTLLYYISMPRTLDTL